MQNLVVSRRSLTHLAAGLLVVLLGSANAAHGQLRIISYNTSTGHNDGSGQGIKTPRAGMDIVLESIGEETVNGIARPIDVLLLQEQASMSLTGQAFVDLLNGIYGAGTYARSFVNGATSEPNGDAGRPGLVYNTTTVELVEELSFGTVNGTNQARSTMRYALKPVGYGDSAIFWAYNDHYKAGNTSSDQTRRNIEATSVRTNPDFGSNSLGEGAHAIFAGDYNMPTSTQTAFQTLIAAGAGQAHDPINRLGSWSNQAIFADVHTQSPCLNSCAADQVGGGMDDRFDMQLVTGEMLDNEGMSIISGSYHPFGNNGTTYNTDINNASNTIVFSGVTSYTKSQILNALKTVSDHIPVVADYQLPSILEAIAGTVPATLQVGEMFDLDLTVTNDAPVTTANGADELDYTITFSAGIFSETGPINDSDPAAGGGDLHLLTLDTATPGVKTGTLTITSTSQQVQNGLVNIPISFEVLAPGGLPGDFNEDGKVDAADYVVWRMNESANNPLPNDDGLTNQADRFNLWRDNFGEMEMPGGGAGGAVPEPAAALLLLVGVCLAPFARVRLRG